MMDSDSTQRLAEMTQGLRAGTYITDGTKTLDADGLRRIWEELASLESDEGPSPQIDRIRALLPDYEKV